MAEAAQREQMLSYAHLAALAVGPILLMLVLWLILRGGKRRAPAKAEAVPTVADALANLPDGVDRIGVDPVLEPGAPRRTPTRPVAQPIADDPQKIYIREQIESLAQTNPAMVAQLIQTWMDEDRRN
jgi:flagellar biosynthesis/type III secretory pathway M-ring protein FliF/YscJ